MGHVLWSSSRQANCKLRALLVVKVIVMLTESSYRVKPKKSILCVGLKLDLSGCGVNPSEWSKVKVSMTLTAQSL